MNDDEKSHSSEPEDIPSTDTGWKLEATKLPEAGPADTNSATPIAVETPQAPSNPWIQTDRPRYQWNPNRGQTKRLHLLLLNLPP